MASKSIHSGSYQQLLEIVKTARMDAGVTQIDIARAVGEDQSWISKIETGERRMDVDELRRLCDAIGIDLSEVVLKWESALGRATPASKRLEVVKNEDDRRWTEHDWKAMVEWLVEGGFMTFAEIASFSLGALNPPQVATSLATTNKNLKKLYPPKKVWQAVRAWFYEQSGRCADCKTRGELQVDHVIPIAEIQDAADRLDNFELRCRRCNVIKRPSHRKGGLTFLTTQSGLMWLLLVKRPSTYQDFKTLCRTYGFTMSDQRFQEAWAMARWLEKEERYQIDSDSKF